MKNLTQNNINFINENFGSLENFERIANIYSNACKLAMQNNEEYSEKYFELASEIYYRELKNNVFNILEEEYYG